MVAAPSGVTFPVEGTIKGYHVLAARGPMVKTQSSVDVRRRRHWRRTLLGGGGDWPVVLPCALRMWWCAWSVLAGRCGGPMGV
jgi:hypothetical protein